MASFISPTALNDDQTTWRSTLYPEDWQPPAETVSFSKDKMIQDFSYAGYKRGEKSIPNVVGPIFDVTAYGADPYGTKDSTIAIQNAIDACSAVSTTGGGVVYLPAGQYRVSPQGDDIEYCLYISNSNIVLRGAGTAQTFLLCTSYKMRGKSVIVVSPARKPKMGTIQSIRADLLGPTFRIPVDASLFVPGDIVSLQWTFTNEWIIENRQETWWNDTNGRPSNAVYLREIIATNPTEGWIEIDVPTRYTMKMRDGASVRTIRGLLTNVGIESFSIGNLPHPGAGGWGNGDFNLPDKPAYDVHNSKLIQLVHGRDCWISSVHSYQAIDRFFLTCHMLSNGMDLVRSSHVTVQNCQLRRPQYGGGGGNGYMYRFSYCNECLILNCIADFSRHGFSFFHAGTSGNVLLQCQDRETKRATGSTGSSGYVTSGSGSDNHMHFCHSNLWDQCQAVNSYWIASHRLATGSVPHGVTSSQGVFWNTIGNGTRYTTIVTSEQLNYGYVIGTSGTQSGATNPTAGNTDPPDHLEGIGMGANLIPPSLYIDQVKRRLAGGSTISSRLFAEGRILAASATKEKQGSTKTNVTTLPLAGMKHTPRLFSFSISLVSALLLLVVAWVGFVLSSFSLPSF